MFPTASNNTDFRSKRISRGSGGGEAANEESALIRNREMRFDLKIIASWIEPGSRILGLGCGEGELLHYLKTRKRVRETGIEIVEARVAQCIEKGLCVLQGDINREVEDYPDNAFDYVILSQTLQQVYDPTRLIRAMLRVGKKAVVSFPNFGHWRIRTQLMFSGRAPITEQLPYQWFDTQHPCIKHPGFPHIRPGHGHAHYQGGGHLAGANRSHRHHRPFRTQPVGYLRYLSACERPFLNRKVFFRESHFGSFC